MKKVSFFLITLFWTTLSCTAMQPVSLTHSQQDKYLSDDWTFIPNKKSTIHAVISDYPYSDAIIATVKYKPATKSIKLCYSDRQKNQIYASSTFALPENQKEAVKMHCVFIKKNKTKALIALDDRYFILPVPAEVIAQDNIKK